MNFNVNEAREVVQDLIKLCEQYKTVAQEQHIESTNKSIVEAKKILDMLENYEAFAKDASEPDLQALNMEISGIITGFKQMKNAYEKAYASAKERDGAERMSAIFRNR
ncbi:MAG: hypothetical protein FWB88_06185 [Defluviitaleaceae bacterium]|nr:hypothetical protein [Defluviitaleaceae bacterium]MCL2238599.1 hypothetical protein [Defluviitaleaceae bacterium]